MDPAELRALRTGELLDAAARIYRRHFGALVKLAAVVAVPQAVLTLVIQLASTPDLSRLRLQSSSTSQSVTMGRTAAATSLSGSGVATAIQFLALTFTIAVCMRLIASSYLGEESDASLSLRSAGGRFWSLLGLGLLGILGLSAGLVTCGIASIWLAVAWSMSVPALMVEGAKPTTALGRSWRLVSGRWWATFWVLSLGWLLKTIVGLFFTSPLLALFYARVLNNGVVFLTASAIIGLVTSVIISPFVVALIAVVYFDLRIRKEGFDLQVLAQRVGPTVVGPGSISPPPPPGYTPPRPGDAPPPPGWTPTPAPPAAPPPAPRPSGQPSGPPRPPPQPPPA